MSILVWNIRGLNDPLKQNHVRKLKKQFSIICIVENKVRLHKFDGVFKSCFEGWNCIHNTEVDSVGRLWMVWDPAACNIVETVNMAQHIQGKVEWFSSKKSWVLSAIYGANDHGEREMLWRSLGESRVTSLPWIIAGDFNIIRNVDQSLSDAMPELSAVREFNECLEDIDVLEHPSSGGGFTWSSNPHLPHRIAPRTSLGAVILLYQCKHKVGTELLMERLIRIKS